MATNDWEPTIYEATRKIEALREENTTLRARVAEVVAEKKPLAEVAERLEKLADQWEEKADRSLEEAERIRATIKAETDAEDRCRARTTLWLDCATEIRAALADEKETTHGE